MPDRRTDVVASFVAVALLLLASTSVVAQPAEDHRDGFWLSGGLGGGFDQEIDNTAGAAVLRMGGTLGSHFLLGGEALGLSRDRGDVTTTRSNVTATVLYYPSSGGSFFFKGGIGFARVSSSAELDGVDLTVSDEGLGTTLGLGHDFQLGGGNLYLTPALDFLLQTDDLDVSDTVTSVLLTVAIGFR